jgi:hypothetical protein
MRFHAANLMATQCYTRNTLKAVTEPPVGCEETVDLVTLWHAGWLGARNREIRFVVGP